MHRIIRQMILGFGTFGTGTALLYLDVNPYLLILTDTVVGVGMLFAAGSLTVDDLHLKRAGVPGEGPPARAGGIPAEGTEGSHGFRASLQRLRGSLKPSIGRLSMGKEEQKAHAKEIDRMLDTALVGQSKRLISIAEGKAAAPGPAPPAVEIGQPDRGPFQDFSRAGIAAPFRDEEGTEGGVSTRDQGALAAEAPIREEVPAATLLEPEEAKEEAQVDMLSLPDEGIGADDLLSALRLEAMKEKKRDDTSLLRDLKGVKVTGKQLLDELDSLVKEMRGR